MSDNLQAARDAAVDAIANWLTLFGEEVGREARDLQNPVEAITYVFDQGEKAVREARTIVGEGFDKATVIVTERIESGTPAPLTEAEIDAQVEALASDPDTWVIEDDEPPSE